MDVHQIKSNMEYSEIMLNVSNRFMVKFYFCAVYFSLIELLVSKEHILKEIIDLIEVLQEVRSPDIL